MEESKLQAISELVNLPSYQYLLEIFDEEVKVAEEELAMSSFSAPKLYGWQVLRHIAKFLREKPAEIRELVLAERLRAPDDTVGPQSLEMFAKMRQYYASLGIEFPPREKHIPEESMLDSGPVSFKSPW